MRMRLQIITPLRVVFEDDVDEVTVPTSNGYVGILPNHVPLVTNVTEGELSLKKGGQLQYLAVAGGFMEVAKSGVTILADYAVRSEEIELAKAEEARKRAERLMAEKLSERDFARVETDLRRSLLELKVARRRRGARVGHPSETSP